MRYCTWYLNKLDETSSLSSGFEYWASCKLIHMAGKFSGLSVRLKELFDDHPRWYQSVICLVTTGLPDWFNVCDFVPSKGGLRWRREDVLAPQWPEGVWPRRCVVEGGVYQPHGKADGHCTQETVDADKETGVTLGGRGEGKLTNGAITKLSAYYGTAIRAHPNNLSDMQDAVLATFHHVSSTDGKPQHDLCPKGKESWCFFQWALAEGKDPGDQCSTVSLYIIVFYVADCLGTMFKYTSHTNRAATK